MPVCYYFVQSAAQINDFIQIQLRYRPCHSAIHGMMRNEVLARSYYSVELLMTREDVQKWAKYASRQRWGTKRGWLICHAMFRVYSSRRNQPQSEPMYTSGIRTILIHRPWTAMEAKRAKKRRSEESAYYSHKSEHNHLRNMTNFRSARHPQNRVGSGSGYREMPAGSSSDQPKMLLIQTEVQ